MNDSAETFPLMIAGAATSGPAIELRAPYDGRLLATLESADARAVEQALETAHALWRDRDGWLTPARYLAT